MKKLYEVMGDTAQERKQPDEKQLRLFAVANLTDYYHILPSEKSVTVTLSRDEMAAILQAYDYGINACDDEGKRYLDCVITKIKQTIHP